MNKSLIRERQIKTTLKAGEMTQLLRTLGALANNLSLIPRKPEWSLTSIINPVPGDPVGTQVVHTHACRQNFHTQSKIDLAEGGGTPLRFHVFAVNMTIMKTNNQ